MTKRVDQTTQIYERLDSVIQSVSDLIVYLYDRWEDEWEYECLDDYADPIRRALPEGSSLVDMNENPFGFHFTMVNLPGTYALYVDSTRCWCENVAEGCQGKP